ncbi:hypothetical protein CTAM01_17216 [Colletotrichum tamarilloi]|uniref:Uncharacterized protein n=1 Tax=Colletotrichum tamarilloi TaxID=1209934 RepID=A0ABQ9QGC9_9PEZI|nr:uncharacterized protein CTAM01_17216 [Colletotrichum tamarilloi]KAK1456498.1 hypothetical protein CTAM01_17216 [Colletotrichum tamarilloi]
MKCRVRYSPPSRMSARRNTQETQKPWTGIVESLSTAPPYNMAASTHDQHHRSGGVGLGAQPTKKTPDSKKGRFAHRAMASRPHCVPLGKEAFWHLGESLGERCGRGWRKTSHLRLPEEQTAGGWLLAAGV